MKPLRLLSLILTWMLCAGVGADSLLVVKPRETELTRAFVDALQDNYPKRDVQVALLERDPYPGDAALVVTMGLEALEWRLRQNAPTPTIAVYVTRYQMAAEDLPSHIQVLLASPRPERQLLLAQLLFPRLQDVGMLYSPSQRRQLEDWQRAARQAGLTLHPGEVTQPLALLRTLSDLLDRSDVLLGMDDPEIYNAGTLKPLLLASYSRNRVLIGPSAPFIAAGSLSTTYSTPRDMADSVYLVQQAQWQPGAVRYPQRFSVLSNAQVARSLGLALPDDEQLQQTIQTREGNAP